MSWSRIGSVECWRGGYRVARSAGLWVVRGLNSVYAWSGRDESLAWTLDLPGDHLGGNKLLSSTTGTVVTAEDHGPREPARLLGLDPAQGRIRWERSVALRPGKAGLCCSYDAVLVAGSERGAGHRILILDADTGAVRRDAACPSVHSAVWAGALFVVAGRDGVVIGSDGGTSQHLAQYRNASSLTAAGDNVVFGFEDEAAGWAPTLTWLSVADGRERGRMPVPPDWRADLAPVALPAPGCFLFQPGPGLGLRALDIATGGDLWSAECEPDWDAVYAVATQERVAARLCRSGERDRLRVLDPTTGQQLPAPPAAQSSLSALAASEGELLVLGATRHESFMHVPGGGA
ncbi:MAG: PQQ-binding-like beta-propeller repeat protein [Deltaproteobacteria bacterium]|nr:PQQ-binding-like beta-propeller repeat protein [Deltaproteobacteria bacterium]